MKTSVSSACLQHCNMVSIGLSVTQGSAKTAKECQIYMQ